MGVVWLNRHEVDSSRKGFVGRSNLTIRKGKIISKLEPLSKYYANFGDDKTKCARNHTDSLAIISSHQICASRRLRAVSPTAVHFDVG